MACAFLMLAMVVAIPVQAQDDPPVDAPRVTGTLHFTCTPDPKTKAAGATAFDDTLDVFADRIESKALKAEGFPIALAIPKIVNGVTTFNATFKKTGATATYFIRHKADGTVTGSLTRMEGGKTRRYTIGTPKAEKAQTRKAVEDVALDPAVLRVNGRFVRLMNVRAAMAEARVGADKAKLAELLDKAGTDQNALRVALLKGELSPADYAQKAGALLDDARGGLAKLLGDDEKLKKVDAGYEAPFAAGYVRLSQMRAAIPEVGAEPERAKRADQAVYQSLMELALLAKKRDQLTPEAAEKIVSRARDEAASALGADRRDRFERILKGMAATDAADAKKQQ